MVDRRGFPTATHPENLTAELPPHDELWLCGLADALWPAGEYAAIVQRHGPWGTP